MFFLNIMVCASVCYVGSFIVDDAATCNDQAEQVEVQLREQYETGSVTGYSSFCDKKPHFKIID